MTRHCWYAGFHEFDRHKDRPMDKIWFGVCLLTFVLCWPIVVVDYLVNCPDYNKDKVLDQLPRWLTQR